MFARTSRLLLRPGWMEDAPALAAAIGDQAIVNKLARAPWPYCRGDAEQFLGMPRDGTLPDFLIFARTRGAPKLAGGIGLTRDENGDVELGYWIARPFWGLGFATEAGMAVLRLADEGLRIGRVVAGHFVDNPASARVLRKLGFVATGRIEPRDCRARGCAVPMAGYTRDARAPFAFDDDPAMAA